MFEKHTPVTKFVFAGLLLSAISLSIAVRAQDTSKRGRKYKSPPATAHFEVTVTRATNGKPVENASVIFHPLVNGHNDGNMELKTNDEGKAILDLLEIGSDVRLQIIAPGYQTYGEDYKVDKDNVAVEIKLKRPTEQYSLYKKGEGKAGPDPNAPAKPDAPKDAKPKDAAPDAIAEPQKDAPDPSKDTPKEEAKPQDATQPKF